MTDSKLSLVTLAEWRSTLAYDRLSRVFWWCTTTMLVCTFAGGVIAAFMQNSDYLMIPAFCLLIGSLSLNLDFRMLREANQRHVPLEGEAQEALGFHHVQQSDNCHFEEFDYETARENEAIMAGEAQIHDDDGILIRRNYRVVIEDDRFVIICSPDQLDEEYFSSFVQMVAVVTAHFHQEHH